MNTKLDQKIMRVSDLPEDQSFALVQDSQDVRATLESIGKLNELDDVGCLFVEVLDGDYGSVYALERYIPTLNAIMWQLQ